MIIESANQSNSKFDCSPLEKKDPLNWNAIIGVVAIALIMVLGIVLIGLGAGGIIPLVAGLAPGLIFVTSPLVIGAALYLRQKIPSKKISPPASGLMSYAKKWCLEQRKIYRDKDDLKLASSNTSSTNSIYDSIISECKSKILTNIYLENEDLTKCIFNVNLDPDNDNNTHLISLSNCFSLYYLIQQAILKKDSLFEEAAIYLDTEKFDAEKTKEMTLPLLCLLFSPFRDGRMTLFRVGFRFFVSHYAFLRKTVAREKFFDPSTTYYQLRLMFNDLMRKMDEIFDVGKVREALPLLEAKEDFRKNDIQSLLFWSFQPDDGSMKFDMLVKKATINNNALSSRAGSDIFYS